MNTIKQLRKQMKLSQQELASMLNVHQTSVSQWETNRTNPDMNQVKQLTEIFNVSANIILGLDIEPQSPANPDEQELLSLYQNADSTTKRVILAVTNTLVSEMRERYKPKDNIIQLRDIPRYTVKASAGTGQFLDSDDYDIKQVGEEVPVTASFGVLISGDSMSPKYPDNSTVWVQHKKRIENGQAGIFYLNGDVYCKVLRQSNNITQLASLNPQYEPITINEDDELRCYGLVVGVTKYV